MLDLLSAQVGFAMRRPVSLTSGCPERIIFLRRFEFQLAGALQIQLKRRQLDDPPWRNAGGFFVAPAGLHHVAILPYLPRRKTTS